METRVETTESSKGICNKGFALHHNCVRFPPTLPREEPLTHFAVLQLEDSLLRSFEQDYGTAEDTGLQVREPTGERTVLSSIIWAIVKNRKQFSRATERSMWM